MSESEIDRSKYLCDYCIKYMRPGWKNGQCNICKWHMKNPSKYFITDEHIRRNCDLRSIMESRPRVMDDKYTAAKMRMDNKYALTVREHLKSMIKSVE